MKGTDGGRHYLRCPLCKKLRRKAHGWRQRIRGVYRWGIINGHPACHVCVAKAKKEQAR